MEMRVCETEREKKSRKEEKKRREKKANNCKQRKERRREEWRNGLRQNKASGGLSGGRSTKHRANNVLRKTERKRVNVRVYNRRTKNRKKKEEEKNMIVVLLRFPFCCFFLLLSIFPFYYLLYVIHIKGSYGPLKRQKTKIIATTECQK